MKRFLVVSIGLTLLLSTSAFAGSSLEPASPQSGYQGGISGGASDPPQPVNSVAWEFTTAGNPFTNGNWTFGEVFVPTQNIAVNLLGYYGSVGGFSSDHPVGIFDASGNLLAQTDVTNSSTLFSAHFVFNQIPTITLLAGQTYVIEGVSNTDNYTWDDPGFQVYGPLTILGNNWIFENGLNFNGTFLINDVSDGYWGADFGLIPVSEPGSLLILLGSGAAGLAQLLRRKLNA